MVEREHRKFEEIVWNIIGTYFLYNRNFELYFFTIISNMGRLFMEHHGGVRYYECANCKNYLCNAANIISKHFFGASGRAILFQNVVNVNMGEMEQKQMATGLHHARDIYCQKCKMKLGWMYEMAHNESQMYKEGKFVLERKFIKKCKGFEDGEKCSSPGTAESSTQPSPITSDVEQ